MRSPISSFVSLAIVCSPMFGCDPEQPVELGDRHPQDVEETSSSAPPALERRFGLNRASTDLKTPLTAAWHHRGPVPMYEAIADAKGDHYGYAFETSVETEVGADARADAKPRVREGVITMPTRPMSARDIQATGPLRRSTQGARQIRPKLSSALSDLLDREAPDAEVVVLVSLFNPDTGVKAKLDRQVASGRIANEEELELERQVLLDEQAERVGQRLAGFLAEAEAYDATILEVGRQSPFAIVRIQASAIPQLAKRSDIRTIEIQQEVTPTAVSGVEVRNGAQLAQYLSAGFDGAGVNGQRIRVAAVESVGGIAEGYDADHPGFRDSSPTSAFRISDQHRCGYDDPDSPYCVPGANSATGSAHATGVAGILFGDVEDGQIPSISAANRPRVSGYTPEADGALYFFTDGTLGGNLMLDYIAGLWFPPQILSNSYGHDDNCNGLDATAERANNLYKAGMAFFAAAGNNGGSSTNCEAVNPGSAIGSFAVGAHMSYATTGDARNVRTGAILSRGFLVSSWGGNATEGQNRSIVSMTGPGSRTHRFIDGGYEPADPDGLCCTSLATPTVASAAAQVMDFFAGTTAEDFVEHPGVLYSLMLLMGDRQGVNGKTMATPDHRWGVGRLRSRMFNNTGMDAPWYSGMNSFCVSQGQSTDWVINNGTALNTDTDHIKVSLWWYDHLHTTDGWVADVNLAIMTTAGQTLRSDPDPDDNKAWAMATGVGGKALKINITGTDVAGHDDPVCGYNSIQVFAAYFAEDGDRESPTYNTSNGTGIYPETL